MDAVGVYGIVGEIVKGSKTPTDVINAHVTRLQANVGLTCGTVQEVSNKLLQDLATKAGANSSTAEFKTKYREAAALNVANLAPLLEVLQGISGNPNTKHFLSLKHKEGGAKHDYNSLKERLLQQVGSVLDSASERDESGGTRKTLPFPSRKLLTNDFVLLEPEDLSNSVRFNYGSLGCIPVSSQENALIQDLLFCFIGIPGIHLKPQINTYKLSSANRITFELEKDVDPTLKALVFRIVPLCQYYSILVQFTEKYTHMQAGRVNQALSGAIREVLKDYLVFVAGLETQHRKGELTLNKIWFSIQTKLEVLSLISDICVTVDKSSARGGKTLSLLHEMTVEKSSSCGDNVKSIGFFLTEKAAEPWFNILTRWVHKGMIDDPGKDFFVEDNEVIERSALPLEYSDDYWERRYSIKADQIPAFLHSNADKILRTGKYLNVIQQCHGDARSKCRVPSKANNDGNDGYEMANALITSFSNDFEGRILRQRTEMLRTQAKNTELVQLKYTEHPEEYDLPLENAYTTASKSLLQLLLSDNDLIGHLKSVKHYFLLDQGDFVVQFFDVCGDELMQNVDNVEPSRLESLLELAIRTSVVNSDPYKDNVRVELLPYDLIYQMNKILSIDTEAESEFKGPVDTADLTGLEAFAFGYDVQWPISLILNRKSLACYQMLLRHLFYCKHVEKLISQVWLTTKVTKNLPYSSFHVYGPCFALKQKMLNFLQNLEYYMTFEVLDPNWEEMISKIKGGKVSNVDQVLQIHSDFLTTCLNDCLLSNPILLTTVRKLLGVCCEFSTFMNSLSSGAAEAKNDFDEGVEEEIADTEEDSFKQEVTKIDLQFTSVLVTLLDKISQLARENYNEKILNILHRLDFNGFYSKALDTFCAELKV